MSKHPQATALVASITIELLWYLASRCNQRWDATTTNSTVMCSESKQEFKELIYLCAHVAHSRCHRRAATPLRGDSCYHCSYFFCVEFITLLGGSYDSLLMRSGHPFTWTCIFLQFLFATKTSFTSG